MHTLQELKQQLNQQQEKARLLLVQIGAECRKDLEAVIRRFGVGTVVEATESVLRDLEEAAPVVVPTRPLARGRRRAVITDHTRAHVRQLVNDGLTARQISKEVRISVASVQNVKKALGLVNLPSAKPGVHGRHTTAKRAKS